PYPGHHYPQQRPEGHAPPAHYPAPYPRADYPAVPHYAPPAHYPQPQPLMTYPNAYPAPYQPPGYVMPGQPVVYPGQFHPYGQPVQHIIVLSAGQQPQVITAESAATLFAERAETTSEEVRSDKALTGAEPETDGGESTDGADQEANAPEAGQAASEQAPAAAQGATDTARTEVAEAVSEVLRDSRNDLLNEALAGLAMRDLSLVDALLEMVEELETDAQDPDLLDKLFQIDNFATRMRRNGENFLVLTGHDGGESDAHDEIVPLLDVARAATSEIKDYPRVSLGKLPQTSITGLAADDISHLLAELLDNATANSPEHSQVVISAQEMDGGRLMIVVEDEGVGIPDAQLVELNHRLNGEPVLDDEVPKHMGLYVASRIARKHGLQTRLESRSFRGISAYTIIPRDLLRVATPRQPGRSRTSTPPTTSTPVNPTPAYDGRADGGAVNGSSRAKAAPPAQNSGGSSSVTAAGLPRRSATPHGSPLRMLPHPKALSDNPPPMPKRDNTPPRLTGEARAEQIRDEIGDFLDGERAARDGDELEGDKE
ncbi:sensor histidine kinase KdpD, partial [Nocardiopsis sp. MG754419]|uniref:sensor histidine kinase n=1 Tax=Nocardiopsis sp. MG754419 TaxID=2259865 RepID=UPI0020119BC9